MLLFIVIIVVVVGWIIFNIEKSNDEFISRFLPDEDERAVSKSIFIKKIGDMFEKEWNKGGAKYKFVFKCDGRIYKRESLESLKPFIEKHIEVLLVQEDPIEKQGLLNTILAASREAI